MTNDFLSKIAPTWFNRVKEALDARFRGGADLLFFALGLSVVSGLISRQAKWPFAFVFIALAAAAAAIMVLDWYKSSSATRATSQSKKPFGILRASALAALALYVGVHFGWSYPAQLTQIRTCQLVNPFDIENAMDISRAEICAKTPSLFHLSYAHRVRSNIQSLQKQTDDAWKVAENKDGGYNRAALESAIEAVKRDPRRNQPSQSGSMDERYRIANKRLVELANFQPGLSMRDELRDGKTCNFCPELMLILPGKVKLGSPINELGRDDDEGGRDEPELKVAVPFAIGTYEVSRSEWYECYRLNGGCRKLASYELKEPRLPITNVSNSELLSYVQFLSIKTGQRYRLPYEIEWEFAARAGSKGRFGFDDPNGADLEEVCFIANGLNSESKRAGKNLACSDGYPNLAPTVPISRQRGTSGYFAPNSWGLYHMLGNAEEWVNERFSATPDGVHSGRQNASNACKGFVTRGGHYLSSPVPGAEQNNPSLVGLRIAMRTCTGSAKGSVGFRVVREVKTT